MVNKPQVVSVRLTDVMMAALKVRADAERQPVSRMASLIIEDALAKPQWARAAPLAVPVPPSNEVMPRFRQPTKRKKR